jgi:hypothetical protein
MEKNAKGFEFKKFATPRIIGGIAIAIVILWALSIIFNSPQDRTMNNTAAHQVDPRAAADTTKQKTPAHQPKAQLQPGATGHAAAQHDTITGTGNALPAAAVGGTTDSHATAARDASKAAGSGAVSHAKPVVQKTDGSHNAPGVTQPAGHGPTEKSAGPEPTHQPKTHLQPVAVAERKATQHGTATGDTLPATAVVAPVHKPKPKGVAFVEATIQPLSYELDERWWGWRPNDIIDVTDNINNFQMGVLEVTRRTTVALAERISRTGTTDAFNENLEQAMNWFMIKASSYWFPSAESKYHEGLEELQAYLDKLKAGNATFYTRTDNLIPLLASFEDLLGSCDENLVKETNEDGTALSTFDVDNYFYYTQGVASSMVTVLEAVHHDFLLTLESRNATELLHHAITSCQRAAELDPWFVLDRNLSRIFANHRANMAAPISHARFYLGQLIKTLST